MACKNSIFLYFFVLEIVSLAHESCGLDKMQALETIQNSLRVIS